MGPWRGLCAIPTLRGTWWYEGGNHESLSFQGLAHFVFLILYSFLKEAPSNKNFRAPLHYGLTRVPQPYSRI